MVAQGNRMQGNRMEDINHQFREALERPAEMVKEYPLASMLLMFGVGMGLGVIVSNAICSSLAEEESTASSMANSFSHMTGKLREQTYAALENVLPPAMLKQLQNYTR